VVKKRHFAGNRHLDFGHCLLRLPDANG